MRRASSITRRSVLVGGLVTLAGCRHAASPRRPPAVSPDAAALAQARAGEAELIAAYDAAITAATGHTAALRAARATHVAHLAALAGGSTPAPTAAPPPPSEIGALLRENADTLRTLAIGAVGGHNAAVLASIAASHEVSARD